MADGPADTGPVEPSGQAGGRGGPSQAEQLVELAKRRYRLCRSTGGDPFAVSVTGPRVARPLRGGRHSLRADLARTYHAAEGRVARQSALADAMQV